MANDINHGRKPVLLSQLKERANLHQEKLAELLWFGRDRLLIVFNNLNHVNSLNCPIETVLNISK